MNPIQLYNPDQTLAYAARCGKCHRVWDISYAPVSGGEHGDRKWTPEEKYKYILESATSCCDWRCRKCGEPAWSTFQYLCREHLDEINRSNSRKKEAERFAKASLHPDPSKAAIIFADRVYQGIDAFLEANDGEELPEYVWCARPGLLSMDADQIIQNATTDMHEDAAEQFTPRDIEELQTVLDAWCGKFPVLSYEPDYKQYVMIPEEYRAKDHHDDD